MIRSLDMIETVWPNNVFCWTINIGYLICNTLFDTFILFLCFHVARLLRAVLLCLIFSEPFVRSHDNKRSWVRIKKSAALCTRDDDLLLCINRYGLLTPRDGKFSFLLCNKKKLKSSMIEYDDNAIGFLVLFFCFFFFMSICTLFMFYSTVFLLSSGN